MKLILIILGVLLVCVIIWIFRNNSQIKTGSDLINSDEISKTKQTNEDSKKPDSPQSFGYKCTWIAVKSTNCDSISKVLKLKNIETCNWNFGIKYLYEDRIFITPSIDGWVLVAGISLPDGDSKVIENLLNNMSKEFGEAQYFSTHRVVEYHCWIKSVSGKIVRHYSYLGESGENITVLGEPTSFEKKFNLINTFSPEASNPNYYENEELIYPDEEFVMEISGAWSVNPNSFEDRSDLPKSVGLVGKR